MLVDRSLRTSAPDVCAAGDCAEIADASRATRNLLQQVWYTGKTQGRIAADAMAGDDVRYDPGIWFNSAKFLDLEYQTYGEVNRARAGASAASTGSTQSGLRSMRVTFLPTRPSA